MKLEELFKHYRIWDQMQAFLPPDAAGWEVNADAEHIVGEREQREARELTIGQMPLLIAYAYEEMHQALHPVIKLSWMVNLCELCLRWGATLLISEVAALQAHDGIPSWCQDVLRYNVERPTLGSWVHILRELTREAKGKLRGQPTSRDLWKLHDQVKHHFARGEENLIHIRNQFAHDGITAASAQATWRLAEPQIEDLVSAIVKATHRGMRGAQRSAVIAAHEGELHWLMGLKSERISLDELAIRLGLGSPPEELSSLIEASREAEGSVSLVSERGEVRYLPHFVVFGELESDPSTPVIQIYAKLDQNRVAFTPIRSSEATVYLDHLQRFESFLGLNAKSKLSPINGHTCEDDLLRHNELYRGALCGRELELDIIAHWLFQSHAELSSPLGWVGGEPGMGKSHFLSTLAHQLHHKRLAQSKHTVYADYQAKHERLPSCPVFYHRFTLDDPRCHVDVCLRLFAQRVHAQFKRQLIGHEERFDQAHYSDLSGDALEDYICALVTHLKPRGASPRGAKSDCDLALILDAVDLLELEGVATRAQDAVSPMTRLLDAFERITQESELDLRVLISTSDQTPPLSSSYRAPAKVLAQSQALEALLRAERQRFIDRGQHRAVGAFDRDLSHLKRLRSGLIPPLSDAQVRRLLVTAADGAYATAINDLGKDRNNIRDNPFLSAVIEASSGSPLYLQLVLDELSQAD